MTLPIHSPVATVHWLYTIRVDHVLKDARWKTVRDLELALSDEFPGLVVCQRMIADTHAAVIVTSSRGDVPPDAAFERLDGWGHGLLTLELVR